MNTNKIVSIVESKLEPWELQAVMHALELPYDESSIAKEIEDIIDEFKAELETRLYPEDIASEYADSNTMVYTYDLLQWYAFDYRRLKFADEYMSEYGCQQDDGVEAILRGGQYYLLVTFAQILLDAIERESD